MARHRHSPSPARSTVYHQDQCRHSATLPSVSHSKCTCSRTDFIPSWLQHVQTSYNDTSRELLRQASPGPDKTSWHPNDIPTVRIQSGYDAGRYQSSDVLIQDTPSPSPLAAQTSRHRHHECGPNSDYGTDLDGRKGCYDSKPHVSTPPRASIVEHDIFAKRPRHKTRKDRYNTAKLSHVGTGKQQAKRSSTRISKNGKLRSSREIMANFKSGAITNPDERITLKPSFTPGLFLNGRSSAPVTDLVFNEIPSPSEGDRQPESEYSSKLTEGDASRQDKIKFRSNASRCPQEDYPPPGSVDKRNSRATSITSSYDFPSVQRSITTNGIDDDTAAGRADTIPLHGDSAIGGANDSVEDNNGPSPQPGCYTLHIRSIYSLSPATDSYFSDLDMLNKPLSSDANSMQGAQRESATRHHGLITGERNNEHNPGSCNPTKPVVYEDKGVMVSPWMHQRTEKHESGGSNGDTNRLWPNAENYPNSRAELHSPNTSSQQLPHKEPQQDQLPQFKSPGMGAASIESQIHGHPTHLPNVSEKLNLTAEIKDIYSPHSDSSPACLYGTHNAYHALRPYPHSGPSSVGGFKSPKTLTTQSRDACSIDMPAQLANSDQGFQPSPETCQDSSILCSDALHAIDDIRGEPLMDYIERMEREILGPAESSTPRIDGASLPAQDVCQSQIPGVPQMDICNEARCSNHLLRGIESKHHLSPRSLVQQPVREEPCWPSRQYQRLPYPGESLKRELESELASFWQPNHTMRC